MNGSDHSKGADMLNAVLLASEIGLILSENGYSQLELGEEMSVSLSSSKSIV
jgi:hypothetical protein